MHATSPPRRNHLLRRIFFWLHLVIGTSLALPIAFLALTGMILAFDSDVVSFAERDQRSTPATSSRTIPAFDASLPAAVRSAIDAETSSSPPGALPVSVVIPARSLPGSPPSAELESWSVEFAPGKPVFINPATAEAQGTGARGVRNFFLDVMFLHRWYAQNGEWRDIARNITGFASLGFLSLVISGLILWIPLKWHWRAIKAKSIPSTRLKGKAFHFVWHNALGFWFSAFLVIMLVAASWISYPQWRKSCATWLTGEPPAQSPPKRAKTSAPSPVSATISADSLDLETTSRRLQNLVNWLSSQKISWSAIVVPLSPSKQDNSEFRVVETCWLASSRGAPVKVTDTAVLTSSWKPLSRLAWWQRLPLGAHDLHTGRAFGLPGAIAAFLSSLATLILVATGIVLVWRRFSKFRKRA